MLRSVLASVCLLALGAGCSDDGGDDDAATTVASTLGAIDGAADAGSTPAATASPAATPAPVDTVDLPAAPSGTDDVPIVPLDTADVPVVPADTVAPPVAGSTLLESVLALTPADVCALTPRAELEAIVGMTLTEPIELDFEGLGAACSYVEDVGGSSATVAGVELSTIGFNLQIDATADVVSECTVGGRTALCQDEFVDSSMRIDATVVVALGAESDPALVVTSSNGLDAAVAVAELALANLAL